MKSQHRHELQTNELGRVADKVAHDLGGFFERYGNKIMIAICVVSLAASLAIYKVRSDRGNETAAWRDLALSRKPEEFRDVWERHPDTQAALWARVHEGEARLGEGIQSLFSNVESGTKQLKEAREALQAVLDQKGAPPEVRERAQFALARALEAGSDGNEGEAVKAYKELLREFPATIYKKDAESRIVALEAGSGQEFYEWFAKYQRPKPSDKRPHDRIGSDTSLDTGDLINDLRMQNPGARGDESGDEIEMPAEKEPESAAEEKSGESKDSGEPAPETKSEEGPEKSATEEPAPGSE